MFTRMLGSMGKQKKSSEEFFKVIILFSDCMCSGIMFAAEEVSKKRLPYLIVSVPVVY